MSEKTVKLVALECPTCGVIYGVSEFYQSERFKDHKAWKCPNGHGVHYPDKGGGQKVEAWKMPEQRN